MNRLSSADRASILHHLLEGSSIASTARLTKTAEPTISRLQNQAGAGLHEVPRHLGCRAYAARASSVTRYGTSSTPRTKQKWHLSPSAPEEAGTIWLWIALCSKTRLIIDWGLGDRSTDTAVRLLRGVKSRMANTRIVQIATDGHHAYTEAIPQVFGERAFHARLIKPYNTKGSGDEEDRNGDRYPRRFGLVRRNLLTGLPETDQPDPDTTAYVERLNLSIRMNLRRYTRRTNGFSKRLENHAMAVALYITYYNFARGHESLKGQSPAMAAGLVTQLYDINHIVALWKSFDSQPGPRGPYRKTRERLAAEARAKEKKRKKRKKARRKAENLVGIDCFENIGPRRSGPPLRACSRRRSAGPPAHVLKRSRQKRHERQLEGE